MHVILTWPYNPIEEYTVKLGYQLLQLEFQNGQLDQFDTAQLKPLWQAIWSLTIPCKVKNLVLKATKNSLPTKKNLVKREIITRDSCELYHDHQEDVKYALYLCSKLYELWNKVPIWNHRSLKQVSTFVDLLGCIFAKNKDLAFFSITV